ncbi:hypothetical protein I3842_16G065400 [Carya illinoinensis]|uniref:Uncharacterized protein n=1 Tax=Carya illinoinensis TaxID=32201 RepID=A0A922A7P5_CARIL|nr:hypothetical protein I3842_16G065400 [Carya illinoinensis]
MTSTNMKLLKKSEVVLRPNEQGIRDFKMRDAKCSYVYGKTFYWKWLNARTIPYCLTLKRGDVLYTRGSIFIFSQWSIQSCLRLGGSKSHSFNNLRFSHLEMVIFSRDELSRKFLATDSSFGQLTILSSRSVAGNSPFDIKDSRDGQTLMSNSLRRDGMVLQLFMVSSSSSSTNFGIFLHPFIQASLELEVAHGLLQSALANHIHKCE